MITDGEYDVKDQTVVEMGAGAGLPSIISVLSGAKQVSHDLRKSVLVNLTDLSIDSNIRLSRKRDSRQHPTKY